MRDLTVSEREKLCEDWNASNPVGTKAIVTDDDGNEHHTITTSEAGMLGGHTPVISTEWKQCYHLSRVKAE